MVKATFEVSQNSSYGLSTPLSAELMRDTSKSVTLDVIFTVITSPDSPKSEILGPYAGNVYQFGRRDLQAPITGSGSDYGEPR